MPVVLFKHMLAGATVTEHFTVFPPAADLAAVIGYFFRYRPGASPSRQLAFADGLPSLVFLPGREGEWCFVTPRSRTVPAAGYLVGARLEGVYLEQNVPAGPVLGVRFTPEGLYHLLGYSPWELRGGICRELTEVFGPAARSLLDDVQGQAPVRDKITRIEAFIRSRLPGPFTPNALFAQAVQDILVRKGQGRVDRLAGSLRVDYKWLERQFLRYLGISPKEFARSQRFLHAYFDLEGNRGRDAMGAAVRNGYYDQNHLGKEFKRFTLRAPLAYWQAQGGVLP